MQISVCIHIRDRKRISSLELVKYEKFCIVVIRFYTKRHSRMRRPLHIWNCNRAVRGIVTRASHCIESRDKNRKINERKREDRWKGIEIKVRQEEQKIRKLNKWLTSPRVASVMIFNQWTHLNCSRYTSNSEILVFSLLFAVNQEDDRGLTDVYAHNLHTGEYISFYESCLLL